MKVNKRFAIYQLVVIALLIATSFLYSGHSSDENDLRFVSRMVHSYKTKNSKLPQSLGDVGLDESFVDKFEYTRNENSFTIFFKNFHCLGINDSSNLLSKNVLTRIRLSIIRVTGFVPPEDFFTYVFVLIILMGFVFDIMVKTSDE